MPQGSFNLQAKLGFLHIRKICFWAPQKRFNGTALYKNLVENTHANFFQLAIQEPILLCLMRNLKAVTMGMATAIVLFWPNRPNPAIIVTENSQLVVQLAFYGPPSSRV